jgi:phasin family protein
MPQTKTASSYAKDFAPFLADFKFPYVDVESVVATQRKNFETLLEANRYALEGARAVAQRQAELMREGFERASELAAEAMAPAAPEKKIAWSTDLAKDAFETGLANYRELFGIATKTSSEVFDLMTKRISQSFDEFRAASNGVAETAKDFAKDTGKDITSPSVAKKSA